MISTKQLRKEWWRIIKDSELICALCGLPIKSDLTVEHLAAKSRFPDFIAYNPKFVVPAIKVMNSLKGNLLLCEWEEQKIDLCYKALENWNLKRKERRVIIKALARFATEKPKLTDCQHCLLSEAKEFCYEQRNMGRR